MLLEEDIFLTSSMLVLIVGVGITCAMFFRNSKDWVYITFIAYALLAGENLLPVVESALYTGDATWYNQGLIKSLHLARMLIWYMLVYQLLDETHRSLTIAWWVVAAILVLNLFLSFFFPRVIQLKQDNLLLDSLSYLLSTIIAVSLAKSAAQRPQKWKYYLVCGFFVLATNIYFIISQIFPTLGLNRLYPSLHLFIFPLGFSTILIRYSNFLHDMRRAIHPVYKPNRKISEQILKSQEEERERIARDLHDQLGSTLATLKMQVQAYVSGDSRIEQAIALIDKASNDVRNIAHDLMPKDFENTDLPTILQSFFYRLNGQSTPQFTFFHTEALLPLSKQFELVLFRIILELVTNITRHSGATEATVQLVYHEIGLNLIVEDNGRGFDTDAKSGIGLKNIRSRVAYLKGKVHIDSNSRGTTTIINLPYE